MVVRSDSADRLVFWVQSESAPGTWYRVDLEALGFRGQCDCPNFRCTLFPEMRRDRKHRECKHIEAALKAFARKTLRQIRAEVIAANGTARRDIGPD